VTRYLVHVAEELLSRPLELPTGFRFIEAGPVEFARLERTVVVEDDGAPDELAGKLIEPIFEKNWETGEVTIVERRIVECPSTS
jgi:hypothetical protein